MTPMIMDAVTAYVSGKRTKGNSNTREARAEVIAVTIPDPRALRLIFPSNRWTFGCSVVIGHAFSCCHLFVLTAGDLSALSPPATASSFHSFPIGKLLQKRITRLPPLRLRPLRRSGLVSALQSLRLI